MILRLRTKGNERSKTPQSSEGWLCDSTQSVVEKLFHHKEVIGSGKQCLDSLAECADLFRIAHCISLHLPDLLRVLRPQSKIPSFFLGKHDLANFVCFCLPFRLEVLFVPIHTRRTHCHQVTSDNLDPVSPVNHLTVSHTMNH